MFYDTYWVVSYTIVPIVKERAYTGELVLTLSIKIADAVYTYAPISFLENPDYCSVITLNRNTLSFVDSEIPPISVIPRPTVLGTLSRDGLRG